jgi:hypothetical protein
MKVLVNDSIRQDYGLKHLIFSVQKYGKSAIPVKFF